MRPYGRHPGSRFWLLGVLLWPLAACSGDPAGTTVPGTAPAPTCEAVAAELCARATRCQEAADGTAPIRTGPDQVVAIVYESLAFCSSTLQDQCGPETPASYNPRIGDPAACASSLAESSSCVEGALVLTPGCGGDG